MCRNIKQLRPARNTSGGAEHPATQDEIKAMAQVAAAPQTLLDSLANPIR